MSQRTSILYFLNRHRPGQLNCCQEVNDIDPSYSTVSWPKPGSRRSCRQSAPHGLSICFRHIPRISIGFGSETSWGQVDTLSSRSRYSCCWRAVLVVRQHTRRYAGGPVSMGVCQRHWGCVWSRSDLCQVLSTCYSLADKVNICPEEARAQYYDQTW